MVTHNSIVKEFPQGVNLPKKPKGFKHGRAANLGSDRLAARVKGEKIKKVDFSAIV